MNLAQKTAARLFVNKIKNDMEGETGGFTLDLIKGNIYFNKDLLERSLKPSEISLIKGFAENISEKHEESKNSEIVALTLVFWKEKERGTDVLIHLKSGEMLRSIKIENFFI